MNNAPARNLENEVTVVRNLGNFGEFIFTFEGEVKSSIIKSI